LLKGGLLVDTDVSNDNISTDTKTIKKKKINNNIVNEINTTIITTNNNNNNTITSTTKNYSGLKNNDKSLTLKDYNNNNNKNNNNNEKKDKKLKIDLKKAINKKRKLKDKSFLYMLKCFFLSIIDPTVNGSIKIDSSSNSNSNNNVFGQGGAAMATKSYGMVCGPNGCH
jgi:hypothetical protein